MVLPLTLLHFTPTFKSFADDLATSAIVGHVRIGMGGRASEKPSGTATAARPGVGSPSQNPGSRVRTGWGLVGGQRHRQRLSGRLRAQFRVRGAWQSPSCARHFDRPSSHPGSWEARRRRRAVHERHQQHADDRDNHAAECCLGRLAPSIGRKVPSLGCSLADPRAS